MATTCGTPYNTGMLNEVAYSTIPFDKGQTTLRVFNDHDPRVARGINAQWHYDGHGQHFHIWNTAFGFESSAEVEYSQNAHRNGSWTRAFLSTGISRNARDHGRKAIKTNQVHGASSTFMPLFA